ncbi:HARBI1 [Mytilus coruscus]|uniref:HARBI1 n=1 Tax=Mytilus coruscus TaxID=42192 RepID=A0A6J8BM52_MYTCO|nr:HARBI1 [Mytilus coruscus]
MKFPVSNENKQNIMYGFYGIKEFPLVLGAVDGTLICIKTPSVDEHLYVSRKEYHALNIQGVCNSNNRFTNVVVARWPGSTHDSHIWNNCNLSMAFESGRITNGWLLGDSGYGLKPWLLTPIISPSNEAGRQYNMAHKSTPCVVERTFGLWKMRFRCLHIGLTLSPRRNINVILATTGLHNKCLDRGIPLNMNDFEEEAEIGPPGPQIDSSEGRRLRNNLVQQIFSQ